MYKKYMEKISKVRLYETISQCMRLMGKYENVQDNEAIYQQFVKAKLGNDKELAIEAVRKLAENYKAMFCLENARNILLDLAKEYLQKDQLAEVTDSQYGAGVAEYIGHMINIYYGI